MPVTKTWAFQRMLLRKNYNPIVLEYFGDLDPSDEDFNTGRKALREGCLIRPKDGQQTAILKQQFFYNVILEAHDKPAIYGIPVHTYKENVTILPQIQCHFKERDDIAKANNRPPLHSQVSIRFKGDVSSKAEVEALGRKIKSIFDNPRAHYTKGREHWTYYDPTESIVLQGYFQGELDAEKVFKLMLDIQTGIAYKNSCLSTGRKPHFDWTPNDPETIGGKTVKTPQQRIPGEVYFTHAELKHKKLKSDILLYSAVPQRRRESFV